MFFPEYRMLNQARQSRDLARLELNGYSPTYELYSISVMNIRFQIRFSGSVHNKSGTWNASISVHRQCSNLKCLDLRALEIPHSLRYPWICNWTNRANKQCSTTPNSLFYTKHWAKSCKTFGIKDSQWIADTSIAHTSILHTLGASTTATATIRARRRHRQHSPHCPKRSENALTLDTTNWANLQHYIVSETTNWAKQWIKPSRNQLSRALGHMHRKSSIECSRERERSLHIWRDPTKDEQGKKTSVWRGA